MVPKNDILLILFQNFFKIFSIKSNVTMIFVISVKNCINWCINEDFSIEKNFLKFFGWSPLQVFSKVFFDENIAIYTSVDAVFNGDHRIYKTITMSCHQKILNLHPKVDLWICYSCAFHQKKIFEKTWRGPQPKNFKNFFGWKNPDLYISWCSF